MCGITTGSCPERFLGEERRRTCPRPCKNDRDCGNKRQCLCDGQCGLSCVAPGNYLYVCVPSVVTVNTIWAQPLKVFVCVCVYNQLCQHTSLCVFVLGKKKEKKSRAHAQNLCSKCSMCKCLCSCSVKGHCAWIQSSYPITCSFVLNEEQSSTTWEFFCSLISCIFSFLFSSGRTCPWPLPSGENSVARLLSPTHSFSTLLEVRCKAGFTLPNGLDVTIRRCQGDRQWSGDEPICTGWFCFKKKWAPVTLFLCSFITRNSGNSQNTSGRMLQLLRLYLLLSQTEYCLSYETEVAGTIQLCCKFIRLGQWCGPGLNVALLLQLCVYFLIMQDSQRERDSGIKPLCDCVVKDTILGPVLLITIATTA